MTNLKPIGDKILVKPLEAEEKTAGGIILPDTAKEKPQQGEVMAVGEGRYEDGKRMPMSVKKGQKILFTKYGGDEIKLDGQELKIISESDVLAIIE